MSKVKSRQFQSPEFKAKVGLVPLRGMKTINEIGRAQKQQVIAMRHPEVSVQRCCQLFGLPRSNYYYRGLGFGLRVGDLELMARIDKLYMEHPWMESRSFADHLTTPKLLVGRGRIRRLMRVMGIESLAPELGISRRQPKHPVYPICSEE